jgi:hypothetical protein
MTPKRVGFLVYSGMQALDLVGPMDALLAVSSEDGQGRRRPGYEALTVGFGSKGVRAEGGGLDPRSIGPAEKNRGGLYRGVRSGRQDTPGCSPLQPPLPTRLRHHPRGVRRNTAHGGSASPPEGPTRHHRAGSVIRGLPQR